MKTSLNKVDVVPILFVKVETKHECKNNVKNITKTFKTLVDPGSNSSLVSHECILIQSTCKVAWLDKKLLQESFQPTKRSIQTFRWMNYLKLQWPEESYNILIPSIGEKDCSITSNNLTAHTAHWTKSHRHSTHCKALIQT